MIISNYPFIKWIFLQMLNRRLAISRSKNVLILTIPAYGFLDQHVWGRNFQWLKSWVFSIIIIYNAMLHKSVESDFLRWDTCLIKKWQTIIALSFPVLSLELSCAGVNWLLLYYYYYTTWFQWRRCRRQRKLYTYRWSLRSQSAFHFLS